MLTVANLGLNTLIAGYLRRDLGLKPERARPEDMFRAVALSLRELSLDTLWQTEARYSEAQAKRVYYLSLEFLLGRQLESTLLALGLRRECADALAELGWTLERVLQAEPDPALGNGGLGRLAACFLDSMATLGLPGFGYGINYEYGLFKQSISNQRQIERPDDWLCGPSPWQWERAADAVALPIYGHVYDVDTTAGPNPMWMDWRTIVGVPFDMPVMGYGGRCCNYLRLFSARAAEQFDMTAFNHGQFLRAMEDRISCEMVSKVLYPTDAVAEGQELRLTQEYFLVGCAVRDIVRRFKAAGVDFGAFPDRVAMQMNDTHPALAVAELMRVFVDEERIDWARAWDLTRATLAYTNHTLLPEALEKWSVPLLARVLPRHLQIIMEINHQHLQQVMVRWPGDVARLQRLSILEEQGSKHVRMGHLAMVGSHAINGVAALHSDLVKSVLAPDMHEMWPARFCNKTNGVTPRRWLLQANPGLAALLAQRLGPDWVVNLDRLDELRSSAGDPRLQEELQRIKRTNKARLADLVRRETGLALDPEALYDVQVKRIHEYKRQMLHVLHIVHEYQRLRRGETLPVPRVHVFAGKAAPGYVAARSVIELIHRVARVVNSHPLCRDQLAVVFIPDYSVSLAEIIIPAADISEQISTAGQEASGTGNMKFAMNGALTVGTWDGANIEIAEAVGAENLFMFGLRVHEVEGWRATGYDPARVLDVQPETRATLEALHEFETLGGETCSHFAETWQHYDPYFHIADMAAYFAVQRAAAATYEDQETWTRKAILNVAGMGRFSSDRTISEYARDIWHVRPW